MFRPDRHNPRMTASAAILAAAGAETCPSQGVKALLKVSKRLMWSGLLSCSLVACNTPAGPKDYRLPEPDLSLDPAALVAPSIIYACGAWVGTQPTEEKIFIDVAFLRPVPDTEPMDRPSARHLAALKKHHGTVAYTFHFPLVRAWIATKDVPGLAADPAVYTVFRVADARRYDWYVSVGYRSRGGLDAGIVKYAELGGQVDYRFTSINGLSGLIPDRSTTALRQDPEVSYVESSTPFANCGS